MAALDLTIRTHSAELPEKSNVPISVHSEAPAEKSTVVSNTPPA